LIGELLESFFYFREATFAELLESKKNFREVKKIRFSDSFCGTTYVGTNSIRPLPQLDTVDECYSSLPQKLSDNQKLLNSLFKILES
jgi:hypothetical protein